MSTAHQPVHRTAHPNVLVETDLVTTISARRWLAASRLAVGFVFLWAFLDKLFGLNYATGATVDGQQVGEAWITGGSPTAGFLAGATGPAEPFFDWLNPAVADWLFMLGLAGIGIAVMTGVGLYVSAVAGSVMMALMWLAEWPLAQGSNNPLVDYHVIYALVLVVCAVVRAGDTWGVGRLWAQTSAVRRWPVLR
jgi:thiosulfate dehydrogenase [quinone] large subunit